MKFIRKYLRISRQQCIFVFSALFIVHACMHIILLALFFTFFLFTFVFASSIFGYFLKMKCDILVYDLFVLGKNTARDLAEVEKTLKEFKLNEVVRRIISKFVRIQSEIGLPNF